MDWLDVGATVLYYIVYPILLAGNLIIYILHWLLSPFIYIGYALKQTASIPLRFVAEFEALWYFLSCAILIGISLALALHFTLQIFVHIFDLDRKPIPKPIPPKGHDAASYRAARQAKKEKELEKQRRTAMRAQLMASQPLLQEAVQKARLVPAPASSADNPMSPGTSRPTLLQQTILENSDEEDDDSPI